MFLKAPAVQEAFLSAAEAFLEQKKSFSVWQVKQVPGVCGAEAASGRAGDA